MKKWKYVITVIVLAVDILLFAELGKETATPQSSWLLNLLGVGDNPTLNSWLMVGLAFLFIVGLTLIARWIFNDVSRWVKKTVREPGD